MFRLIAAALVSAYAILALIGPEQGSASNRAGMLGGWAIPEADLQIGNNYRLSAPVRLKVDPTPSADATARLDAGAAVVVLANTATGYARVRDDQGRIGFVPARVLTSAL